MTDESMRAGRFWKRRGVPRRRNDVVISGMAAGGESFCVRRLFSEACSLICLFAVVCFALFYSREAGEFALSGMRLAVLAVIPSSFVSMLVCDLYRRVGYPERISFFGRLFSLLFGISRAGLRAFLLGNLCGFPMGAREAGEAYSEGLISREEAERLLPICTNPSPAFTVGVVGGMLGDFRVGVRLFFLRAFVGCNLRCGFSQKGAIFISSECYSTAEIQSRSKRKRRGRGVYNARFIYFVLFGGAWLLKKIRRLFAVALRAFRAFRGGGWG